LLTLQVNLLQQLFEIHNRFLGFQHAIAESPDLQFDIPDREHALLAGAMSRTRARGGKPIHGRKMSRSGQSSHGVDCQSTAPSTPQGNANFGLTAAALHQYLDVLETVLPADPKHGSKTGKSGSIFDGIGPLTRGGEKSVSGRLNDVTANVICSCHLNPSFKTRSHYRWCRGHQQTG
jgi:hypothetical protein